MGRMDKHKDGGPAFPAMTISESVGRTGMTMRQYYKGQALIALVQANERRWPGDSAGSKAIAIATGEIADAMTAEDEAHGDR